MSEVTDKLSELAKVYGQKFRQRRIDAEVTTYRLATEVGVDSATWNAFERGKLLLKWQILYGAHRVLLSLEQP